MYQFVMQYIKFRIKFEILIYNKYLFSLKMILNENIVEI